MPHRPETTVYFWLLLAATLVAMVVRRLRLPYSIALVLAGLAIGAPRLIPQAHLEPHLLFTVFLPPLLFEAAINLRFGALAKRWRTIALLALPGTIVSSGLVGALSAWLLRLPLPVGLTFGALISPTDPISVIALFKRLGVEKRLAVVVEAESLFNDGVAVVLFGWLSARAMGQDGGIAAGVQQFVVVALGGAAVGTGVGWLASRVTRAFDDHLLEILLTTVVAFGAYLGAEAVHVSGVIAVVAAGLLVGNYGMEAGMSPTTRLAVSSFWEFAAFAVNSLVFLLVGIEATAVDLWGGVGGILGGAVIVLAGRAASVYMLTPLCARIDGGFPVAWRHVLTWGGLRGALSMALAMGLPLGFPERERLIVLTFGVVSVSLLSQGLTIERFLGRIGISGSPERLRRLRLLMARRIALQGGVAELRRQSDRGRLARAESGELVEEYEARLEQVEREIAEAQFTDADLQRQRIGSARVIALQGEKSTLLEAERNGLVEREAAGCVAAEIDAALLELGDDEHS